MLTEWQLCSLDSFCIRQGVRYYDLRMELVDHLAESIETSMRLNPTIDFDEALNNAYKGFGKGGFKQLVANREAINKRKILLMEWKKLKEYLYFPKILLPISLLLIGCSPLFLGLTKSMLPIMYLLGTMTTALIGVTWLDIKFKAPKQHLIAFKKESIRIFQPAFIGGQFYGIAQVFGIDSIPFLFIPIATIVITITTLFTIVRLDLYKKRYTRASENYPLLFGE